MLRAFGVYLERAETFRKPLQTCCSSRCVSEWIRGCISSCFVLARGVCEGPGAAFWAELLLQHISRRNLQGSYPKLCTFGSCYEGTVLYFQFKSFSQLALLQTPTSGNVQRQH